MAHLARVAGHPVEGASGEHEPGADPDIPVHVEQVVDVATGPPQVLAQRPEIAVVGDDDPKAGERLLENGAERLVDPAEVRREPDEPVRRPHDGR